MDKRDAPNGHDRHDRAATALISTYVRELVSSHDPSPELASNASDGEPLIVPNVDQDLPAQA